MANEITLTSGEQYRPAMLFWRTDRRACIQRQRRRDCLRQQHG